MATTDMKIYFVILFMISITCGAQPILRNEATTNTLTKAQSLVSGLIPGSTNFSAYLGSGLGKSINGTRINIPQPNLVMVKTNATGLWIASSSGLSDGTIGISLDSDSSTLAGIPTAIPWQQIQSNSDWEDIVFIGQPPGMGAILISGRTNVFAGDSFIGGVFIAPSATNFFQSTAFGFASYATAFSVQSSSLAGSTCMQFVSTSTNDAVLGFNVAQNWTGDSGYNTILGSQAVFNDINTTKSNIIAGAFVDPPVSGTGNSLNVGNAIWTIGGLNLKGNTPATATVQINNKLYIAGGTNELVFGFTNTAPAGAATPTKWVSVQINGEGVAYRVPLYQ